MKLEKIFSSCISLLLVFSLQAIDFSRINISWQYDPLAEIELRNRVTQNGEVVSVFLRFRADSIADWSMDFFVQPKYESESHTKFETYQMDTLISDTNKKILKLTFKKPDENLLVIKISQLDAFYYYDVPIKNGSFPFSAICPTDKEGLPVFDNYLNSSSFSWLGKQNLYVQQYAENFTFADPPMVDMKLLAPSILPDSAFTFSNAESLESDYFYVVREDSNASTGVTILKTSPYFPELKQLIELTNSMHYILNESERRGLKNSNNLKQSFDSFWIKTYVTKFRARNAIRYYFNWVKQANRLFTDFKQGWKTDRGMLFIVFGVPDEVYRTDNEEEWYYDNGSSFEFSVISTFFSPRTYALRRRIEFEEKWFEYIAAIRLGTNE